MGWFPIGPDFVFAPRFDPFARLSRRNEGGRQGAVSCIAIEPTDANTIYVCIRPRTGGSSMFLTRDGGASWLPISDGLRAMSAAADPNCVAINPDHPENIYVGSFANSSVYVSNNRGAAGSWTGPYRLDGGILKLVVDPRTAMDPPTTVVYATVRKKGVYRSENGGIDWVWVLAADPTSFVAHMPPTGTDHFYVGAKSQGVWHATDPTAMGGWENLCDLGIGLPPYVATGGGNYVDPVVDFCPLAPERVYAWFALNDRTTGLYTTASSTTHWDPVILFPNQTFPNPVHYLQGYQFAVAPNSLGDGVNDILLFGEFSLCRSIDGGRSWKRDVVGFHADIRSLTFVPAVTGPGVVPTTYLGCDGGLASSLKFADPAVAVETALADFNHGPAYSANLAGWSNLNHGMASTAIMAYASDPKFAAVSHIGCQDTGLIGGEKTLGWRCLADADVYSVAVARGAQGISCWINWGQYSDWPPYRLIRFSDRRNSRPQRSEVSFGGVSRVLTTADFVVGLDGKMITGMVVRDGSRTVAAPIPTGAQTVTPSSMTGIRIGSRVVVEPGTTRQETSTVTATTGTTFTANFGKHHPAGSTLLLERAFVGRVGEDDLAQQISHDFGDKGRQVRMAIVDPTNANVLYCSTDDSRLSSNELDRVWTTNAATAAGPATVWTAFATNRPAAGRTPLSWIAVNAAGTAYALWHQPVPDSTGEITTPLYRLSGGSWFAEKITGTQPTNLGKLVADPVRANVLYLNSGNSVFRLEKMGTTWTFTDISAGLPGAPVYDLWIANIGTTASPKVLLRAAVTTRGIFESDVTVGAVDLPIALYVRDHLLDQAWLDPSPEGMPNPYNPSETLWHYMCADIKIDAQTAGIFQTDPEGALPLSHVHFDMLRDNSQNLRQSGTAKVHVMVHNRSRRPAANVRVWAIYCRASAGEPGLNVSPSMGNSFPFWNQFRVSGMIEPNLPADSPWTSVGPPVTLPEIDADRPRVATFDWTIPMLTTGDTGHYCIVVFVHSAESQIFNQLSSLSNDSKMNVDFITPRSRQIGQKNIHVVV